MPHAGVARDPEASHAGPRYNRRELFRPRLRSALPGVRRARALEESDQHASCTGKIGRRPTRQELRRPRWRWRRLRGRGEELGQVHVQARRDALERPQAGRGGDELHPAQGLQWESRPRRERLKRELPRGAEGPNPPADALRRARGWGRVAHLLPVPEGVRIENDENDYARLTISFNLAMSCGWSPSLASGPDGAGGAEARRARPPG